MPAAKIADELVECVRTLEAGVEHLDLLQPLDRAGIGVVVAVADS